MCYSLMPTGNTVKAKPRTICARKILIIYRIKSRQIRHHADGGFCVSPVVIGWPKPLKSEAWPDNAGAVTQANKPG
ncbi:hypothetical protein [Endozoicomonas sp. 2B-B]